MSQEFAAGLSAVGKCAAEEMFAFLPRAYTCRTDGTHTASLR